MAAEDHFDAELRRVAVPAGLGQRLALPALFDDAAVDRLLGDIAVPEGLLSRVRAGAWAASDADGGPRGVDLERAASMVRGAAAIEPLPPATPMPRRSWRTWARNWSSEGVGVIVALTLMVVAFVAGHESSRVFGPSREPRAKQVRSVDRSDSASARRGAASVVLPEVAGDAEPTGLGPDVSPAFAGGEREADGPAERDTSPQVAAAAGLPPVEVRGAAIGLGTGPASGNDMGMKVVPVVGGGRRAVPRVRGYDLAFEMAHGESPFVSLAAAPSLALSQPPLAMRTGSFDDVLAALADKRLPGVAGRLRVEDVLAAVPPAVPGAADGVPRLDERGVPRLQERGVPRLQVRGVRSLRKEFVSDLVEICVSVPAAQRSAEPPLDVLVVLDQAAGLVPATWSAMCRGLEHVATLMRPEDRVSVVVAGVQPRLVGRRLEGAALAGLAQDLLRTRPTEAGDFDAAMRFAATALDAGGRGLGPRLVVVADVEAADRSRDAGQEAVAAWRESLMRGGDETAATPRFVLIDATESAVDDDAVPSFGRTPPDAVAIRRAVVRAVFGTERAAAERCRLEVTFDPRAVQSYRIVGHRQTVVESLTGSSGGAIDLHAGESVRVVYEVVRRDGAGQILTAALVYRPAGSDRERRLSAGLSATDPDLSAALPSPHGCELLLAVGLGQTASGSVHAGPRTAAVQSLAAVAAAWRKRGDVTAFGGTLIECLDRLGIVKDGARPTRSLVR